MKKQVRFTYQNNPAMLVLEISTDGGNSWEFSRGYSIQDGGTSDLVSAEAITELQRCISLGYVFVLE